jgi:hypothetical protein
MRLVLFMSDTVDEKLLPKKSISITVTKSIASLALLDDPAQSSSLRLGSNLSFSDMLVCSLKYQLD